MVSPPERPCGIGDYTDRLRDALTNLGLEVDLIAPMAPVPPHAQLVHIQHQYFLFGGVAPWKNCFAQWIRHVRVPVMMTVHEIVDQQISMLRRAALEITNRRQFLAPQIGAWSVHTECDASRLAAIGVQRRRISVLRMPVPQLQNLPAREAARRALGWDESMRIAVLFGFISRRKGHSTAIDALRRLPNEYRLVIAGGRHPDDRTDYVTSLQRQAEAAELDTRVEFSGYLPLHTAHAMLCGADVVLAPFLESSGSASLSEAMACSAAVLASDIEVNREYLRSVPNCIMLHRAGDAEDLAGQWAALSSDPALGMQVRAGASAYASQFTMRRMANETLEIYQQLLRSRN
jgi:glycosyltransferase involved in cell wall biosynthesis